MGNRPSFKYYLWILTEIFADQGIPKAQVKKALRELADLL